MPHRGIFDENLFKFENGPQGNCRRFARVIACAHRAKNCDDIYNYIMIFIYDICNCIRLRSTVLAGREALSVT